MGKKKTSYQSIVDKATRVFEQPMQARKDYSKMIAIDDNDFYIENYKKIIKYTQEEISFFTAYNKISFFGENMFLRFFSDECMIIAGEVSKIQYEGLDDK